MAAAAKSTKLVRQEVSQCRVDGPMAANSQQVSKHYHQQSAKPHQQSFDRSKDQTWRQLEELKSLDKVFPDPARTIGCYVQLQSNSSQGSAVFGQVKSCCSVSTSNSELTVANIADYSMNVMMTPGDKSIDESAQHSHPANQLKYLARAYLCNVSELCADKMPESLLNQLNLDQSQQLSQEGGVDEQKQIVLIQTISTKASTSQEPAIVDKATNKESKEHAKPEEAEAQTEPVLAESQLLSEGNSAHRLHALIAISDASDLDNTGFTLYPVVFKSTQNRGKKTARVALKMDAPIDESDQKAEIDSLCYKDSSTATKSLQIARKLQKAFIDSYLDKVSRVELTKANVADYLLSIVSFSDEKKIDIQGDAEMAQASKEDQDNSGSRDDKSVGIATNIKVVRSNNPDVPDQILLFVTLLISAKPGRSTAWVSLEETKVYADLSLGLISQKWLEKLQVHDTESTLSSSQGKNSQQNYKNQRSGSMLSNKLRQVQMLNWQESLAEKRNTFLLDSALVQNKAKIDGDVSSSESLSRKQVRPATATNDTRASNCKKCNYITKLDSNPDATTKSHIAGSMKVVMCSRCSGKYHEKCLQPSERNISSAELNWRCPDCQRCSNCKSQQCRSQLLTCLKCNTPTHYDCLSSEYRHSLRPLYTTVEDPNNSEAEVKKLNLQVRRFRCEDCIKCQNCDTRVAGTKRHHKWSKDFKLCAQCNKMRDKRLFCPVCERFQPSDSHQSHEYESQQHVAITASPHGKKTQGVNKQEAEIMQRNLIMQATGLQILNGERMIKCRQCTMLVHIDCDRMLADPVIRRQIMPDRVEGELVKMSANSPHYKCPNCRRSNRSQLLEIIIDTLITLDKHEHFLLPFWNQMQSTTQQAYLDTIKRKPVCFSQIRADIRSSKKYLLSPKDFWKDIERVFVNAKAWNAVDVYTAAASLHEKANTFIKNKKLAEQVEINSKATMDESRFTLFMRKVAKDLRKGIVPNGSRGSLETQRPTEFKVTAKEMLQGSEVPDLRVFGINNSLLEVIAQSSGQSQQLQQQQQETNNLLMFQPGSLTSDPTGTLHQHLNPSHPHHPHHHHQIAKKAQLPAHKQWEKLMEDLQCNDERDTCWYPNPVKISFTDPALIFEEMCYLCGAFGNKEDFLCCNLCAESFHPYCLPYPKSNREQFQDYWRCYNCMFCEKCHSSKQWEGLLICTVCDKVDHFWCLEPQLIQVPECNWKCPECFKCAKCSTKSFFSDKDIENKVNMDRNEKFVLSYDFELCYQCGLDEYRKSFCSICNDKTGFGLSSTAGSNSQQKIQAIASGDIPNDVSILKCNECNFYSHLDCSKTDLDALRGHAATFNKLILQDTGVLGSETARSIYKCIDCLLVDRLPSYYIYHQCELYESLHQNMQKSQLLYSLLETILVPAFLGNVDCPEMYLQQFAQQNVKFFREDRLIQQWLALLDSGSGGSNSECQSNTDVSQDKRTSEVIQPVSENQDNKDDVQMKEQGEDHKTEDEPQITSTWSDKISSIPQLEETSVFETQYEAPTQKSQVYQDLYGHKTGFLPLRRDLYANLLNKENNRVAKASFFEQLDQLSDKITVPTDDQINQVDVNELFVKIELRAILKIRLLFMQWAQTLVYNSLGQLSHQTHSHQHQHSMQHSTASQKPPQAQATQPMIAASEQIMQEEVCKADDSEKLESSGAAGVVRQQVAATEGVIDNIVDQEMALATIIEFCEEEDVLIDNPQKRLKCLLCGLNGERSITGRLIPFQIDQFVHVNCAMWTQEVQEGQEEGDSTRELYNFFFAFKEFKHITCDFCNKRGATIFCSNRGQKRCPAAFHFPCAYASRQVAFLPNTDIYCESCIPKTPEAVAGFPVEFRNYPKRRIIIVSNTEPQCTMAFQNQLKKSQQIQNSQNQSAGKSGVKGHQSIHNQENNGDIMNAESAMMQNNQLQLNNASGGQNQNSNQQSMQGDQGQINGVNNNGDVGVIIQCNKWRPYYYDMFNRVGNLTLLSLSRRRNSIIESLHTFTHENRNWHERFNLRFPEEDQTDFAALRIYWDYNGQGKKNSTEVDDAAAATQPKTGREPPDNKTYFLFNSNKVQEVERHDYSKVRKYINKRLDEFQKSTLRTLSAKKTTTQSMQDLVQPRVLSIQKKPSFEQFWVQQISNLATRYPLFCQDNTYLTSKVISGLDKFPVQYWNNPGEKLSNNNNAQSSATAKSTNGLELKDLGVAGFFYKSGYKSLEAGKVLISDSVGTGGATSTGAGRRKGEGQMVGQTMTGAMNQVLSSAQGVERGMSSQRRESASAASLSHANSSQHQQSLNNQQSSGLGGKDTGDLQQMRSSGGLSMSAGQPSQSAVTGAAGVTPQAAARNTSLDSIFKQILEANKVNDQKTSPLIMSLTGNNKNEDSSDPDIRQDLSTKVMNYEQIMACLGKKTLKVKQDERRKAEEEKARQEQLQQQQMQLDVMYGVYPGGTILDANGKPTNGQGQQTLTKANGENENAKESGQTAASGETVHHRRKGSKLSDINDMINKGNDINAAMKYRAAKERPKNVEVWISKIHRNGLFACQPLNQKDIIIEYVGEKIREPVADKREDYYVKLGVGDCYNFRLDKDYIIDATFYGSKARYINHSCEPNLISEYLTVNGETHIIFVAARKIIQGEELTFDYNFMPEIESIECFCGTDICRGRLT